MNNNNNNSDYINKKYLISIHLLNKRSINLCILNNKINRELTICNFLKYSYNFYKFIKQDRNFVK
jgi:hypothetical protein